MKGQRQARPYGEGTQVTGGAGSAPAPAQVQKDLCVQPSPAREVLRQLCFCLGCARWKFLAKAGHAHPPLLAQRPAPARPCQVTDRLTDMPGPATAPGITGTEACLPGQRPHWHSRTLTRPSSSESSQLLLPSIPVPTPPAFSVSPGFCLSLSRLTWGAAPGHCAHPVSQPLTITSR